jgi:uncharacterized protein (DUF608 family)
MKAGAKVREQEVPQQVACFQRHKKKDSTLNPHRFFWREKVKIAGKYPNNYVKYEFFSAIPCPREIEIKAKKSL